jgi:hypothetical protein
MATITVSTADLRKAAAWAKPGDTVMPVLANVRVSVAGGQLVLAVYDWEDCRMARFPGPGDGGTGTVLVPHKLLTAAIGTLPKTGQVEVRVEGTQVDLLTKGKRVSVEQDCDPAAYPALPAPPPPSGWCDATLLKPVLLMAAGCTGTDRTLPVIQSVHFTLGEGLLRLEATERHVLMTDDVPCNRAEGSAAADWLIAGPPAAAFARECEEGPVFVAAPSRAGQMAMLADSWHVLVFKTGVGDFPNFTSVTGRMPPLRADLTCDTAVLARVAAEAQTLLEEATGRQLTAVLADKDDKRKDADKKSAVAENNGSGMFVQVTDDDAGRFAVVFAVDPFTGTELGRWELGDATWEGDALVSLDPALLRLLLPPWAGQVTVRLSDPVGPVGVTVPAAPAYQGVIQPIKSDPPVRVEQDDKEEVRA